MADRRLRELQRQADEGDPQAQATLLLARVRLGQVTDEGLKVAALLGHPAACKALDKEAPRFENAELFAGRLKRHSKEYQERAVVAGLYACLEPHKSHVAQHRHGLQVLMARVEDWIECPCDYHLDPLCHYRLDRDRLGLDPGAREGAQLVVCSCKSVKSLHEHLKSCLFYCAQLGTWKHVWGVIQVELLTYALGHGDPVHERAAPRMEAYRSQRRRRRRRQTESG